MGSEFSRLSVKPLVVDYHYDLVGEIGDPEEYLDLLDALREAREEDVVHIHINTPGGALETVAQILDAMENCKGNVYTYAEGEVFSGGSIIFFKGDGLVVGKYSQFLAHGPHGGMRGKMQDHVDSANHNKQYVKELYEDVYSPFYTKAEIRSILRGKELYETAKQVEVRVQKVHADMLKQLEEEVAED